uniref:DNA mismatch repair endonuclease MutL n=1 Tax=Thaumasiovibrio occultus TaxID=1891184 RepID=UPI000B35BF70|nr:DNA mismatch repair endonuclease MutL [Thaumasiovibrio occultus]
MPIQILPARLANQIAAGEVVERPASVVKELVENSLDAGANRIEVDIEKGGSRLIRIRDNGSGIRQEELGLALSRHATSKISTLEDLEAIDSLGFRGEALASISSVSRLTLTSRTADQNEAWLAYAEGREMAVQLKPAAHPVGTTVEVHDLFFNTPARRKFLRTDKTEFSHIDELLKRIALSRFDLNLILRHNNKVIRHYRPAATDAQTERRLAAVCGSAFLQHALEVNMEHGDLHLRGWICAPQGSRAQNDIQYCYVNGRMMKDKLINHAIRQAYESRLATDQYSAYVLFISVDPHQVDVNVHPAKHEVRFHQARLVHDFIYQTLHDALHQGEALIARESAYANAAASVPDYPNKAPEYPKTEQASRFDPDAAPLQTPTYVQSEGVEEAPLTPYAHPASSGERAPTRSPHHSSTDDVAYGGSSTRSLSAARDAASSAYRDRNDGARQTGAVPKQASEAYQRLMSQPLAQPTPETDMPSGMSVNDAEGTPAPAVKAHSHQAQVEGNEFGKVLSVVQGRYMLVEQHRQLYLCSLQRLHFVKVRGQLNHPGAPQPLLIPLRLHVTEQQLSVVNSAADSLQTLGIVLQSRGTQIMVMAVSSPFRQQNLQVLIPQLLDALAAQTYDAALDQLANYLMPEEEDYSLAQSIALAGDVEQIWGAQLSLKMSWLMKPVDLTEVVKAFDHE